jgi:hypothetical protein
MSNPDGQGQLALGSGAGSDRGIGLVIADGR